MKTPHDSKAWLLAVASYMNLSLSELALSSKIAASTLTRYVNDKSGKLTITERSLDAVSSYSGIPKNVIPGERRLPGFAESETVPFDYSREEKTLPAWVAAAIREHKGARNGVEPWIMRSWALDQLGVLPGDILMIDQNKRAKAGDIVCVQISDHVTGRTETVMRRYDPPFITVHSAKLGPQRPDQVDDDRVVIMGVEDGIIRPRH
ncbi:MAG: hypothetical protein ABTQ31_17255 [Rhizobiaceae bacterium]